MDIFLNMWHEVKLSFKALSLQVKKNDVNKKQRMTMYLRCETYI